MVAKNGSKVKVKMAPQEESLKDRLTRLRKMVRDAESMMFEAAKEVIYLTDHWDRYRDEAGCGAAQWVRKIDPRRPLSYYRDINTAAKLFGRNQVCVTVATARWIAKKCPREEWPRVNAIVREFYRTSSQRSMPMTISQAKNKFPDFVTRDASAKQKMLELIERLKARIVLLESILRKADLQVPE